MLVDMTKSLVRFIQILLTLNKNNQKNIKQMYNLRYT